jgi:hypothetical protein
MEPPMISRIESVLLAALFFYSDLATAISGSAVAVGRNRDLHFYYSYNLPEEVAKRQAVGMCRKKGGVDPVIMQSTDIVGFGAAAVWYHGKDWILGVALGCRSPEEAQKRAILDCKKRGGIAPEVRWGWRG